MTSEVTYAEVRFKDGPPSTEPKSGEQASPGNETPLSRVQKCKLWFPWVLSGLLTLLCLILLVAVIVILKGSRKKEFLKSQLQKSAEWNCLLIPEAKEPQLSCCMVGLEQFGSSCYYFSSDMKTWNESRAECMKKGFDLVVINSDAEQDFLTNHNENDQVENFCIGLADQKKTNQWLWVDQTPLDPNLMFWRSNEPSNADENCVVMHVGKGKKMKKNWNDVKCFMGQHHYVCETNTVFFPI